MEVELLNKKIAHAVDRFLDRLWPPTNPEFDDLPTVQVLSARMSDDDVEFISDLRYLQDLTNEIFYHTGVFGPHGLTDMPELPNTFEDTP